MEVLRTGRRYELHQLGGGTQILDIELDDGDEIHYGWHWLALIWVLVDRTKFVNVILACGETEAALSHLEQMLWWKIIPKVRVIDPGHVYEYTGRDGLVRRIIFVKRSSDAVHYDQEWVGTQSQEVMRALIEHLEERRYSLEENILTFHEDEPEYHLRYALYFYEVRAYQRKLQKLNQRRPEHEEDWEGMRDGELLNIPFVPIARWKDEPNIDDWEIGDDGHIVVPLELIEELA